MSTSSSTSRLSGSSLGGTTSPASRRRPALARALIGAQLVLQSLVPIVPPRPVFDHEETTRSQAREEDVEAGRRRREQVRCVVDHEVERLRRVLLRHDLLEARPIGLIDAEVGAHRLRHAVTSEEVVQGAPATRVEIDGNQPARSEQQREQRGAPTFVDAQLEDVRGVDLRPQRDVPLDHPSWLAEQGANCGGGSAGRLRDRSARARSRRRRRQGACRPSTRASASSFCALSASRKSRLALSSARSGRRRSCRRWSGR